MHARLRYACAVRTREQPRSGWEKVARRRREAPQRLDPAANEGSPERAAQRVTLAATFLPVSQEGFLNAFNTSQSPLPSCLQHKKSTANDRERMARESARLYGRRCQRQPGYL